MLLVGLSVPGNSSDIRNRTEEPKQKLLGSSVRYELTILVVSNDILQNFFNFNNFTKNYLKKGVGIRLFGTDFAHK